MVSSSLFSDTRMVVPISFRVKLRLSTTHSSGAVGILPSFTTTWFCTHNSEWARRTVSAPLSSCARKSTYTAPSAISTPSRLFSSFTSCSSKPTVDSRRRSYRLFFSRYSPPALSMAGFVTFNPVKKPTPSATMAKIAI